MTPETPTVPSREQLLHVLYEAAELEHNLMCTYLYAAFSLKSGGSDGLSPEESEAVTRWRKAILQVAIEEMGHLTAVWNITSALGAAPRFGRDNFPLDPGALPAGLVVKLAPFGEAALQHFVHLERPEGSDEPEGHGFAPTVLFTRGTSAPRLTPMACDYDTVGTFYACLARDLQSFVAHHGESVALCGDPALQLSAAEAALNGAKPVLCLKTALQALGTIVEQGEGARLGSAGSHFHRFAQIRSELAALKAKNPAFAPSLPAATNPVLRRPVHSEGRVWIENEAAAACVDLANTGYALMLRLLAYSYVLPRPTADKALVVELSMGLMRAVTLWAECAARLPAGPTHPGCNAGMSFTALRDAAPLSRGRSAAQFFCERLTEMTRAASRLPLDAEGRVARAARVIAELSERAQRDFAAPEQAPSDAREATGSSAAPAVTSKPTAGAPRLGSPAPTNTAATRSAASSSDANAARLASGAAALDGSITAPPNAAPPTPTVVDGVDHIEGEQLTLLYEGKKCIHARFCVTGAPGVFLANVKGPWIKPDAIPPESLREIAHACPSGAIRYRRKDGGAEEAAPAVNLLAIREAGPYAVRAELRLAGRTGVYRATLCRCGASKNKPFCDGSHHDVNFTASGEPASTSTDMLAERGGVLSIDPQTDGPLSVRGNLEITSGTGRVVARLQQAKLCRCGASNTKPFCDGSHVRVGFTST